MVTEPTIRELLMQKDEVTLVDLDGNLVGRADKYEAHKHPAQLHMAVSVWLFNENSEVLLQQRSDEKIVGAGWWGNTVCGNVWPTETYFDCAHRRLKHELGISGVELKPIYKFAYQAYCNEQYGENELDQVYMGKYSGVVTPNPKEVSEYAWVSFDELLTAAKLQEYTNPAQTLLQTSSQLKQITPPVELATSAGEFLIAPWTVFILQDSQFTDAVSEFA